MKYSRFAEFTYLPESASKSGHNIILILNEEKKTIVDYQIGLYAIVTELRYV